MYPQKDNVLSTIKSMLEEREIDITFSAEEENELYQSITECLCRHPLQNIQDMMNERLNITPDFSRDLLDKMYHALDSDEKSLLDTFNEKVLLVQFYESKGREDAIEQLRRIMRAKFWHDSFMDGLDYSICSNIIGYMPKDDLEEFKRFMTALEQTDSQIRESNIRKLGARENEKSVLLYLGEYAADNQQDFYHRIRRKTKDYITLDRQADLEKILDSCESIIKQKKQDYAYVAVAGEGFWSSVANLVAHRQNCPALLINPEDKQSIVFPITNPKTVNILLSKPHDISKCKLPDSWQVNYLYLQAWEVLQNIDRAMANVCWDNWMYVEKERYGED